MAGPGYFALCALACLLAPVFQYFRGQLSGFLEALPLLYVLFPSFSLPFSSDFEILALIVLIP